ncbi:hypothetical protein [Geothrix sp. 21YS21S-2]|uniref:hypothetical protein n=1 Tax=Geothrix sp. 21YS21S-2 TaxID=3068893 RepID=UPI0027BA9E50|nr:hypothetical protein [Geothrix sp. 21YS21S-2]
MNILGSLAGHLKRLATPAARPALTLDEALPRLLPKVRPRFLHETLALRPGAAPPEFRPLAGIFATSLVVDFPDCELDVGPKQLASWGADYDALLQRARTNLLQRGGGERFLQVRPGLFRSTWRDALDGSRILLPGMLKGLDLPGEPVVVLPDRDTLLVAGSEDPRALGWLLEFALDVLGGTPRWMNSCPLRLAHFQWEPWDGGPDHPAAPLLARLRRRRLTEEYAGQKILLDRLHGREVSVAPLLVTETPSGAVLSSTFLPGTSEEAWLPEADRVGRLDVGGSHRACQWFPWDTARARLGSLLEPMGIFPERYRIRAMPAPELLASLLE